MNRINNKIKKEMKKLSIAASMAVAAVALTGCGNSAPKADMKSDVDSLSYAFGIE